MRVLTVARWYPSHDAPGRGSFVADLVAATARAGVDSKVVSFDRVLVRGRLEERDRVLADARAAYEQMATPASLFVTPPSWGAPGIPVARLPMVRRPGADNVAELLEDHAAALRPFVKKLLAEWRPDVIHAHTGLPDGIVAADLGAELGIPVVVSEHMSTIETELANPLALERYRSLLRSGVTLLAVSPALADRVAGLLGVEAARIGVLPNSVDVDAFLSAPLDGREPELLWVGSLGEHKGIDVLLRAFADVRARRGTFWLRLIGEERAAGDRERLEALSTELGVREAVRFDGWADRNAVADAMRRARLFVHASPSETFGVAAAEAILSGLPVAARRSGGVPWVIEQSGGFGRVAEDDSVAGFAAAIEGSLDGPLATDATVARDRLAAVFGAAAVASAAVDLYRELAPPTQGAPPEPEPAAEPATPRPRVLVASGWDHGWRLAASLPDRLRETVTLVVPARPDEAATRPVMAWVQAPPVPPPTRPPSGRSPITRLRRWLYRPPPTGDELLGQAVVGAVRGTRSADRPTEVVALDAPAAALVDRLDRRRVRLAPGSLRWLADRWDADADAAG